MMSTPLLSPELLPSGTGSGHRSASLTLWLWLLLERGLDLPQAAERAAPLALGLALGLILLARRLFEVVPHLRGLLDLLDLTPRLYDAASPLTGAGRHGVLADGLGRRVLQHRLGLCP